MRRAAILLCCALLAWAVDPPALQSPSTARGTIGVRFAAQLDASNSPTSYSTLNLPPGLVHDGSGLISGVPTTAGTYTVMIGAANAAGATSSSVDITVDAAGTGSVSNADLFRVSSGCACSLQLVSALADAEFSAVGLPGDLGIDANGLVSGAPSTAGVIWIEASVDGDTTATTLSIAVSDPSPDAPVFELPVLPQAAAGAPFACLLTASADGAVSYDCSNRPAWLSLSSGLLAGTPAGSDTSVNLKVSASHGGAAADTVIAIPISQPGSGAAVPGSPAFIDGTVGSGISWLATATSTDAVFSALDPLPDGLDLQGDVIIGTLFTAGNVNLRLAATVFDEFGDPTDVITTLAFRVTGFTDGAPQLDAVVPPTLTALVPCALAVNTVVGTTTTYTLSGPAGWSIDNTGLVTATPAAAGVVSLRVTASNAANQSSVTTFVAKINASDAGAPLPLAPVVYQATAGSAFTAILRASPTAAAWSVLGLPTELPLTGNLGLISGTLIDDDTVTRRIDANLQLHATGSGSNATSAVLRMALRAPGTPVITATGPWYLTQGQPARIALAATGATSWSVSGLPTGLSLGGGTISGTPTASGSLDLTLSAYASAGRTTTTAAILVATPLPGTPVFSDPGVLLGVVDTPFAATLSASGASLGYTATPLPDGLSLDAVSGAISGIPTTAGTTTMQVTAQNAAGTVQTMVIIRIAATAGSSDQPVSGVSGGCGAGASGMLLLLLGGLGLWRRRR